MLPDRPVLVNLPHNFQKEIKEAKKQANRLEQTLTSVAQGLLSWAMVQTGLPSNAPQVAILQAEERLAVLSNG